MWSEPALCLEGPAGVRSEVMQEVVPAPHLSSLGLGLRGLYMYMLIVVRQSVNFRRTFWSIFVSLVI